MYDDVDALTSAWARVIRYTRVTFRIKITWMGDLTVETTMSVDDEQRA